jgi:hypothetical protein
MQAQLHAKEIDAVQLAAAHRADLAVITARFSEREARLLRFQCASRLSALCPLRALSALRAACVGLSLLIKRRPT